MHPQPKDVVPIEFVPAIAMLALVWKVVDFAKYLTNRDVNAAVTQTVTWAAGVGVVVLYAQTAWAAGINVGAQSLDALNFASLVAVGLAIGSTGSVLFDFKKARDTTDSAATPALLPQTRQSRDVVALPAVMVPSAP